MCRVLLGDEEQKLVLGQGILDRAHGSRPTDKQGNDHIVKNNDIPHRHHRKHFRNILHLEFGKIRHSIRHRIIFLHRETSGLLYMLMNRPRRHKACIEIDVEPIITGIYTLRFQRDCSTKRFNKRNASLTNKS